MPDAAPDCSHQRSRCACAARPIPRNCAPRGALRDGEPGRDRLAPVPRIRLRRVGHAPAGVPEEFKQAECRPNPVSLVLRVASSPDRSYNERRDVLPGQQPGIAPTPGAAAFSGPPSRAQERCVPGAGPGSDRRLVKAGTVAGQVKDHVCFLLSFPSIHLLFVAVGGTLQNFPSPRATPDRRRWVGGGSPFPVFFPRPSGEGFGVGLPFRARLTLPIAAPLFPAWRGEEETEPPRTQPCPPPPSPRAR